MVFCTITYKKPQTRGVLFGPYCPIYGFGALLVLSITAPIKDNVILVFLLASLSCTILEYMTSLILEKLFNIRWWDYSKSGKINYKGRICVRSSLAFGFFGVVVVQWFQPLVVGVINLVPTAAQFIIAIVLLLIITIDIIVSALATLGAKKQLNFSKIAGDQTAVIKKACKDVVKKTIKKIGSPRHRSNSKSRNHKP